MFRYFIICLFDYTVSLNMCMLFGCFIGSVNYMMRSGTWGLYRWRPFAVYGRRCSLYRTGSLRSWIPSSSGTLWTPVTTTTVITTARKSRTLWREWVVAMETAGGWVPCCQLWMKRDRGNWRRLVPVCRIRWILFCGELFYYSNEGIYSDIISELLCYEISYVFMAVFT